MRKQLLSLEEIKQKIYSLKGKEVKFLINRGRRKIIKFDGIIEDAYSSVFTVKNLQKMLNIQSYSYSDILCGEVKISVGKDKENDNAASS